MQIQDRTIELRRVPASELLPNPRNWRTHPEAQQNAMRGVLAQVGITDALLARETPEGLQLIDGHLRVDVALDTEWPVLVMGDKSGGQWGTKVGDNGGQKWGTTGDKSGGQRGTMLTRRFQRLRAIQRHIGYPYRGGRCKSDPDAFPDGRKGGA
jgi:hypothetical protein